MASHGENLIEHFNNCVLNKKSWLLGCQTFNNLIEVSFLG